MFKRFVSYYRPVRKLFVLDMICAFFVAAVDMVYPLISRRFVQEYVPNLNINGFLTACFALFVLFTLRKFLRYFVQYQGHMVGTKMQAEMRRQAFSHLEHLPFSYFDDQKTGTIMSRVINDLFDISELAHHGPEDVFISAVMLIGSFTILCMINVPLTLIVFAIIPFMLVFTAKKRKILSQTMTRTRVEVGEVNASLESSIGGIRVSKAFNSAAHEEEKFTKNNQRFFESRNEAYKAMAEFYSGNFYLMDLLLLIALSASGFFVLKNWITLADFFAYVLYIGLFTDPIKRLVSFVEQLQSGATGFKRFCELMDSPAEVDSPSAKPIGQVKGQITFEDVAFSYDEESEVFANISFSIEAGKTAAFVGPSGGGKTTLCNLIPRFYPLTSGRILLDDVDVTQITLDSLRGKIGVVQQDTYLFGGTIRDNIAYGDFSASDEAILAAAKKANVEEFLSNLPRGLETEVGERGVKLSGGQKQRISIARVFLKNPPILILDEATSALDNTTELLIQDSLEQLSQGRTTLVVAHRLSTIRKADKIFVITKDGVAEQGNHEELLAKNGLYTDLYQAQFALL